MKTGVARRYDHPSNWTPASAGDLLCVLQALRSAPPLAGDRPCDTPAKRSGLWAPACAGTRSRGRERGFTLVEMMISLLIFGMLAAAGVALLSFSVRAQGVMAGKLDDTSALARLSSALEADLAQASLRQTRNDRGDLLPAFTGENGSGSNPMLRLVRGGWSNLDGARRPGEQKVEYRLDGDTLVRLAYPLLDGTQAYPPTPMLAKVQQVALRYRVNGAWSDRWQGSPETPLPQALEMRLVRSDGTQVRELFLVGTGYGERKNG